MAKAKKIPSQGYNIVLELTAEEAHVLQAVCGRVGGKPAGLRGVVDNLYQALNEAVGRKHRFYSIGDVQGMIIHETATIVEGE